MFKHKASPLILFILLLLFSPFFYINFKANEEESKENETLMSNNIEFEGIVTNTKVTGNHSFGIIELKLSKSNISEFNKKTKIGIYPYKIEGNVAEIYCTVSTERKKGDTVKVVSNEQTVYYNYEKSKEMGSLYIVSDSYNIDFVKNNTGF